MEGVVSSLRGGGRVWGDGGWRSMYASSSYHIAPPGRPPAPPSRREPRPITRILSTVLIRSPVTGRFEYPRVWMGAPSVQGDTSVSIRWYWRSFSPPNGDS